MASQSKPKKEKKNKKNPYATYVPRDVSWMYFNHRILREAQRTDVPLLERLSFLGIYSNNLDEFFRVRVALLNRIAECDDRETRDDRHEALLTLKAINRLNAAYAQEYSQTIADVEQALEKENIYIISDTQADEEQRAFVKQYFLEKLDGTVAPIWFNAVKNLSDAPDDAIYLAVKMRRATDKSHPEYALIQLPVRTAGRFVTLPQREEKSYIMYLDDAVRLCLPQLFGAMGYTDFEAYAFKFTKDAEMEIDNDLRNGLLQKISKGVKSRKKGAALRVIYDKGMPRDVLKRVMSKLGVDRLDTILASGRYQNHKDLMSFPSCGRTDLKYAKWAPVTAPELGADASLLEGVKKKDRFIHVPYNDFSSYIRLLQEAAVSKEVKGIQTTLYRLARESKVVKALINAAQNGKQVTVVIELLARFDEASNISWSKKMQDVGIHVIFGVEGLKVHSKVTHISMRKGPDIAVVSTGNFHEGNARCYTDCLLFTAKRNIVRDVEQVFHFIEHPYLPAKYRELLVSPNEMRNRFTRLINDEMRNHDTGKPSGIRIKINHITDQLMVRKLYEASQHGVKIELVVRGNCSLVTGVKGLSENIRCVGIIDRYLEHARIFEFCAAGEWKTFMGSADWMPRNLNNRVEVVTPVYDPDIKARLHTIVSYALRDTLQGRTVDGTDRALPWIPEGQTPDTLVHFRSQEALYCDAVELCKCADVQMCK